MPSPRPTPSRTTRPAARPVVVRPARAKGAPPKVAKVAKSAKPAKKAAAAIDTTLTLSSKNYSSWSLRGWLLARFAGLPFREVMVSADDPDARMELLLLAPSIRVPCLRHDGATVWNTLGIAQYLNEVRPKAHLMPDDRIVRAHCRSICGEMNSGFANLRAALPMNIRARYPNHKVWAGARPDIDRIVEIWSECLKAYGGPYLFGEHRGMADAMYAPVVTRFRTYDVKLPDACAAYCDTILAMPEMQEWIAAAKEEPMEIEDLDMDF